MTISMHTRILSRSLLAAFALVGAVALPAAPELRDTVRAKVAAEYPSLRAIYEHLHANPELSFMEVNTAALVAKELRALGIEVTEKVGNTGVVGVLRNGPGPTVLIRTDMDALPVKEEVPVPYASKAVVKDLMGRDQPAMHACAHDMHVTSLIGSARTLVALKNQWSGTIVFVAQPAEEIVSGARAMLADGIYTRFPHPDFALALHVSSWRPAGVIGQTEGPATASSTSVDITVRGVGGHGSAPHTTKDPIVLAAQIVVALQTIVSREVKPGTPAVVTVGTIRGGTKRNIISEEVKLELTLRCFDDKVAEQLVTAIKRICAGTAAAAGVPEDRMPVVTVTPESAPVMVNTAELTRRLTGTFTGWFGSAGVEALPPTTGAEDFSEFGRTLPKVPLFMWWVGAADPAKFAAAEKAGRQLPSNHSPVAAFQPEPTLEVCVTSTTAAVLDLLGKK